MKRELKIKVCGMREKENILEVCKLAPDYIGFIFYKKSPRFVKKEQVLDLLDDFPNIKKVGVFVDPEVRYLKEKIARHHFDYIQLHGKESVDFCSDLKALGVKIIKAFALEESFSFLTLNGYEKVVDYFLFDTKSKYYGGSGKSFDWQILKSYNNILPVFLSGGLSLENITAISDLNFLNLAVLDFNSCFEKKPALKNIDLLKKSNFPQLRNLFL